MRQAKGYLRVLDLTFEARTADRARIGVVAAAGFGKTNTNDHILGLAPNRVRGDTL